MNETKQTEKTPVNKEAFKMLATEIGLNEACRRLCVPIPTGKSWAQRGGWKLPKRTGGRPERSLPANASSFHPIADALDASHKELGDVSKTAILQTVAKAAQLVAQRPALTVTTTAELRDLGLTIARLCGDGKPQTEVNITNQVGIVCTEKERQRLIALRAEIGAPLPKAIKQAIPALPSVETQSSANVGAPNASVANEAPEPCTKPQATAANENPPESGVPQWMQDISGAASWKNGKGSEPEDHAGSFGNEEYDI